MPIKYITIPEPIQLHDPIDKKELLKDEKGDSKPQTFAEFVNKLLFNPLWAESYKNIKSAKAIDKAFENQPVGAVVQLAEEDWKKMKEVIENPKQGYGYHTAVMPQLLPFLDAIMDAKDEGPK